MITPDGIYENDSGLYTAIIGALEKVTVSGGWRNINSATGTIDSIEPLFPFYADDLNTKYNFPDEEHPYGVRMNDYSGRGVPVDPTFQQPYVDGHFTGTEMMFEVVAKEILNYLVGHVEVAMKARMDKLESDYNKLLIAINDAATNISNVTTSAVTNLRYGHASISGVDGYNYYRISGYDVIDVIEPDVLSEFISQIQLSGGGIERQSNTTDDLIATNEVLTVNGEEYVVHIR